jgi:biopolymer transport protein ExbB/TolQ
MSGRKSEPIEGSGVFETRVRSVSPGAERVEMPALLSDREIIEATTLGLRRSINTTHMDMKRGLNVLATIAATAPLVGLLGTALGIIIASAGCIGQRDACRAAVVYGLSQALATAAIGLSVAVPAAWAYNHLSNKMEALDIEMKNSALEVMSYLTIRLRAGSKKDGKLGEKTAER